MEPKMCPLKLVSAPIYALGLRSRLITLQILVVRATSSFPRCNILIFSITPVCVQYLQWNICIMDVFLAMFFTIYFCFLYTAYFLLQKMFSASLSFSLQILCECLFGQIKEIRGTYIVYS